MTAGLITTFSAGVSTTGSPENRGTNSLVHGYGSDIQVSGSGACFAQGRLARLNGSGTQTGAFVQGDGVNCYTSQVGITHRGAFVQGHTIQVSNNISPSDGIFAQGHNITLIPGLSGLTASFSQGSNATAPHWASFAQGFAITASGGGSCFAQGYGYGGAGALGYASFSQGAAVTVSGTYSFGQGGWYVGVDAGIEAGFAQGNNVYLFDATGTTAGAFAQGKGVSFTGISGSISEGVMFQGNAVSAVAYRAVFAQGKTVIGSGGLLDATSVQGRNITLTGNVVSSFVQGTGITVSGNRIFAQGDSCHAIRDDQRTWGSNRAVLGGAQSSKIVKYLQTASATQTTMLTLDLEQDKTYAIDVKVVARNTDTNTESARFSGSFLAYRDTAGSATLVGGTALLSRTDSGGGSVDWEVDIAAVTNDILLRVTGDAFNTVQWCADFEFVEVAG